MTNLIEKARIGRENALSRLKRPTVPHCAIAGDRTPVRHFPATFTSTRAGREIANIFG
ncbi:MAG: hypothetical protein R3E44_11205 [Paracoccaceae bacterium]